MESSRRALAFGSVKTRFKAFWNMFFLKVACGLGFAGTVFIELLPPEGDLGTKLIMPYAFWQCFWMIWQCFLDDLAMISGWFGNVFQMIWQCFPDDFAIFSGWFDNVFWMFWVSRSLIFWWFLETNIFLIGLPIFFFKSALNITWDCARLARHTLAETHGAAREESARHHQIR